MNASPALDVSHLPTYAFGPRGLMWGGTMGMLTIEGTVFAILIVTYFYLRIEVISRACGGACSYRRPRGS